MNERERSQYALGPYRVLDLTDEKGVLCTKLLADLGADVIKIEPPGGDPMRRNGPFYHDEVDPEKSLFWFTFNTSKRSITLDITKSEGHEILKKLVKTADFLVECFPPGYLDSLGLGYAALSLINPRLVMTSITNFGQTGPYRDYKASDIVGMAMGGLMYVCGDPDRPPVRIGSSQAYAQVGAQAAVGTLFAHHHRQLTGEGQHVDVSMQEAIAMTLDTCQQWWDLNKVIRKRGGIYRDSSGRRTPIVFPCKDGHVSALITAPDLRGMIQWMDGEGMAEDLIDPAWREKAPPLSQADLDHFVELFIKYTLTKGKQELFEEGQKRRLMFCPVNTVQDIYESPQLNSREFFVDVEHPELGEKLTYPGAPYIMGTCPWQIWRRPPLIGEHNTEVFSEELGMSEKELAVLRQAGII